MVEVAEVCGIDHAGMGAEGVLGTVEVEVAVGDGRILGDSRHEVLREAVAHPERAVGVPVVGPRLLLLVGTRHGEHAGDAVEVGDHALGVAGLGDDEELAETLVALHGGDSLVQQLGGEALMVGRLTPLELPGAAVVQAATVTAPVEEHVVAGIGRDDRRQLVAALTHEDAHDVGCGKRRGVVVNHGSCHEVGSVDRGADGAWLGILSVISHGAVGDEDDMVVVEPAALQLLIDAEHVG